MADFENPREVCRDFKRNVCNKGYRCKFYHPPKDVGETFSRNAVCHDFQNPKVGIILHPASMTTLCVGTKNSYDMDIFDAIP